METAVLERSPEVATLDVLEAQLVDARRAQAQVDDKRLHSSRSQETEVERLTREAYAQAQTAYGTELLADQLQEAESEAERNSLVAQYLIDEFRALQEERETPTNQDLFQRAKRLGRSALRATGVWLSRGNRGTQIVKSALVTGVASVFFGALGGGIAAAGGMAAVRYGKAYASGISKDVETHHSSATELTEALNTHEYETVHAVFEHAQAVLQSEREAHIDATQERNTKARRQALGAMVVGAVIGTTAGSLIHYGSDLWTTAAHAQEIGGTHVATGLADGVHETTGTVVLPHQPAGDVAGSHATIGEVDTVSHESTGTVVIQEHETAGTVEGSTGAQSAETTGLVGGVHETSGKVELDDVETGYTTTGEVEGMHETVGTIEGVYATTGTIEGVHETAGTIDGTETPEVLVDRGVFTVEAGNGLIRENIQWAEASGYDVPNSVMEQLHHAEVEQFGAKGIIDLQNYEQDIYMHGTDVRINAPDEAVWREGVVDFKVQWLSEHGYHPDGGDITADGTMAEVDSDVEVGDTSIETTTEVPSVQSGEGINSFVARNYDYILTPEQSIQLGERLHAEGYAYSNNDFQDAYGNPYGFRETGKIDVGMDAIIQDMVQHGTVEVAAHEPTFSAEDWSRIEGMLAKAADRDMLSDLAAYDQPLMDGVGERLQNMYYADGSPVVSFTDGHWSFNDSEHMLPQDALDAIHVYLNENDTVAEKIQRLTKML